MKALLKHLPAFAQTCHWRTSLSKGATLTRRGLKKAKKLSYRHRKLAGNSLIKITEKLSSIQGFIPSPTGLKINRNVVTKVVIPLKGTLITLLFAIPQVSIVNGISTGRAFAQTSSSCPSGTTSTTLDWNATFDPNRDDNLTPFLNQNLSVGGIRTTFSFSDNPGPLGAVTDLNETSIRNTVYGGFLEPHLQWNIGPKKDPARGNTTLTITFAQPVILAEPLNFLDIDRDGVRDVGRIYQDRVTVTALNGTTPVNVSLQATSPNNVRVTGNIAVGINENAFPASNNGNVEVTPSGAITQIRVFYEPGTEFGTPIQDESIGLRRIKICTPIATGNSAIGDTVFEDRNGDGTQEPGEPGIPNVTLSIIGAGPDNQFGTPDDIITNRTTSTNGNGIYGFNDLPPGNYRVTVTPPQGFAAQPTTGSAQRDVTITPGQNLDTVDFGFRRSGALIGDEVFIDRNNNGTREPGEAGINNVTLILRNANAEEIGRTTTNAQGIYGFTGLQPGNYTVQAVIPNGFNPTNSSVVSPGLAALPATIVRPDQTLNTIDFGFRSTRLGAAEAANLRLVKRITNVFRNGQPLNNADFSRFIDVPNQTNDDQLPNPERFVGQFDITNTPLLSGDEAEYTIYYILEGNEALQNVRFCDSIPTGTTYSSGLSVTGAANQARVLSALAPLPEEYANICRDRNNANGSVVVNFNTVPGGQFGFIRFRVRIN
jgi:uncharacterized repeat protein (TIGR01451 family)